MSSVLDGVMLLWFVQTAVALAFVAIDIRSTPESPVLKWGFVLLTAYTGVVGAFLYVLGCREPLPGLHEQYVAARWRQVLGSTMHCVAGDGVGIIAGAVIGERLRNNGPQGGRPRIRPRLRVRLDDLPGAVHARHGRRLLPACARRDLHLRAPVDEPSHGGHDPDRHVAPGEHPDGGRSARSRRSGS